MGIKNQQSIEETPFAQSNSGYTMHSMLLRIYSLEEEVSIMANARNKTSTGMDVMGNKLLKYCCSVESSPLEILFKSCMNLSYFPEQFKIAKIIPTFKEGSKDDFSNDRPIFLLPAILRVFELIIFKRVYSYVKQFKLLMTSLDSGKKTIYSLACVMEQIRASKDQRITSHTLAFSSI